MAFSLGVMVAVANFILHGVSSETVESHLLEGNLLDSNGSVIDADSIVNEELSLYTAMLAVVRSSGRNAAFSLSLFL